MFLQLSYVWSSPKTQSSKTPSLYSIYTLSRNLVFDKFAQERGPSVGVTHLSLLFQEQEMNFEDDVTPTVVFLY